MEPLDKDERIADVCVKCLIKQVKWLRNCLLTEEQVILAGDEIMYDGRKNNGNEPMDNPVPVRGGEPANNPGSKGMG